MDKNIIISRDSTDAILLIVNGNEKLKIPKDNREINAKDIYDWNKKSTTMTIESMKKFPQLKSKVLFVLQNRNERVFEIWRKLFVENRVWEHFDLYSFGGLVGLKKSTKVDFNHAVPATMWLFTYAKKYNFQIKQLH